MAGISEELGLDIGPALQGIDSLEQALQDALRSAEVSVEIGTVNAEAVSEAIIEAAQAPEIVLGEVDADEVAEAIEQAARDAVAGVEVEDVDASEVTDAIEDALQDADLEIERFDASMVREELEDAASDAELAVEIGEVDASLVGEEIEEEAEDARPRVELDEVDASEVEAEIERAARDAVLAVEVSDVDASAVTEEVEAAALAASDLSVTVTEVDASAIPAEIEAVAASARPGVDILPADVNASAVAAVVEQAAEGADVNILIEADASQVEDELADVAAAAEQTGGSLGGLSATSQRSFGDLANDIGTVTSGVADLGAAVGAGAASFGGLPKAIGPIGGVLAGVAAATSVFLGQAVEAEAVTNRFTRTFGSLAEEVDRINVGGLNTSLSELAIQIGASDDGMRSAVTNLALLGRSSGATAPRIAETSEQILALAARAAVLNPELGDAGAVADALGPAFARGGRALSRFAIDLDSAEIEARALKDTGKATAAELSIFDKVAAGAALQTEKLGTSLAEDIRAGSEEAQIQFRALRTAIGETVEELGAPLVDPVSDFLRQAAPTLTGLVQVIGQGVRLATTLAVAAGPAIQLVAGALQSIASVLGAVADFFNENEAAARAVAIVLATLLVPTALRAATALAQVVAGNIINGLLAVASAAKSAASAEGLGALAIGARQAQTGLTALGTSGAARAVAGLTTVGALAAATGFQFSKTGERIRNMIGEFRQTGTATDQLEAVRAKIKEIERDAPSVGEKIRGIFVLGEAGFDPFGLGASSRALRALRDEEGRLETQTDSVAGKLEEAREALGQVPSTADQAADSFAAMATVFQQEGSKAGEAVSQMFQETQSAAESFAEAVRSTIPSVTETIQSLEEGAGPKDLVKGLREETVDLDRFFADIRALIDRGATDTARALLELGPEAAGALAHSLVGLGAKGVAEVEKATDERNAAIERGNQASEDLLNKLGAGVDFSEMSRKLQEEAKAITEFPAIIANLIRQGFSQVAQALLEQGPIQGRAFAAATQTASQEDLTALNAALGAHEAAIRGFAPAAAAAAASVGQAEGGALVGALGAHSTAAAEVGLGVGNAWQTGVQGGIRIGQAKSTADAEGSIRIIDGVARVVAPGLGAGTGAAYGGAIGGGIRGQGGQMADAARATLGAAAAGSGAGGLGALAGKSFSEGMASGIRNTLGPVGAAAIELAKRAVEALIDKIKGRSPSEVTAEIGEDWGAGFILGMERTEDGVARASERLAFAAEDSFRTAAEVASPSRLARSLGEDWAAGIAAGLRAGQEEVALAAEGLNEAAAKAIRPPEIAAAVTLAPVVAAPAITATADGAALGSIQVSAPVSIEIPITGPVTTEAVPVLTGQVEAAVRRGLADHQRELVSALRAARR